MSRPNILMICSDQHTPRVVGCYGDKIIDTPNLDALASQGTRFDAVYCNNPICVPSRASFMTGRYTHNCGVLGNQMPLRSEIPTMAHMAVRGGYHAVLSGKMHFYGPDQRHGFLEHLVGELGGQALYCGADTKPAPGLQHLGNCSRPQALKHTGPGQNQLAAYDEDVTKETAAWLENYAGLDNVPPFFMVVGYLLPHCPYIAPKDLYDKYKDQVELPDYPPEYLDGLHQHHKDYRKTIELDQIPRENEERALATYYGLTDLLDQNIGVLLDTLEKTGQLDNTIILYYSDHGDMIGRHGRWHKECFREDSARVPLIIRHPKQHTPAVVKTPHSLVDLMPTLCEWFDVPCPPALDGESLVPALAGTETSVKPVKVETYTHWTQEEHGMSANRMVRKGNWKLCYYGAYDSYELFNLADDPEEMENRIDDPGCVDILAELKPELFTEGWSRNIVLEVTERLNQYGELDNVKAYRDALVASMTAQPRYVDIIDHWEGSRTVGNFLD